MVLRLKDSLCYNQDMEKIILASGSPRRKELLKRAGLNFEVCPSSYEEELSSPVFTYAKIENLAYNKAYAVADETVDNAVIIGADTVVVLDDIILGKPQSRQDAFNMLKSLSGKKHIVVTGICVINKYNNTTKVQSVTTTVEFENLTDEKINYYLDNFKPFDKAGSYGIQELPEGYVKSVEGSLENVIGLCTKTVLEMLKN